MEVLSKSKSLLNPLDRSGEILFGLIMALTFTCTISIAHTRTADLRHLLIGAIGCNLAWGIIDATMYLIEVLSERNRNKIIFDYVQSTSDTKKAGKFISDSLPPVIASVIGLEELEKIRIKLLNLPAHTGAEKLNLRNIKKAFGIFILVFISTFPVVIPFVVMHDTLIALRISNLIAIIMMFLCGWSMAGYAGANKWRMSSVMVLLGVTLVAITIALGG